MLDENSNLDVKLKTLLTSVSNTIPTIGYTGCELLVCLSSVPTQDDKVPYLHKVIEYQVDKDLLKKSFDGRVIYVYDEVITIEIVMALHSWFKKQACNIENIIILSLCSYGLAEWYIKYCDVIHSKGVKIIDVPWYYSAYYEPWRELYITNKNKKYDNVRVLDYYFDYYGGSASTPERDVVAALMLTIKNIGHIEYFAGYQTEIVEFDELLEELTGFCNRSACDEILTARLTSIINSKDLYKDNLTRYLGVDNSDIGRRCAVSVIRETIFDQPFSQLTEKTLKIFLDMQVPIPMGYKSVDELEKIGFKFDHTIVNYSYQYEPIFFDRMIKIVQEIVRLHNTYTLKELAQKIYNNKDIIEYNYEYIVSGQVFDNIHTKFIKELND